MNSQNQTSKTIKWLAMWDMYGLECLLNLTEWEQKHIIATLKEEKFTGAGYPSLSMMIMRAQANIQRNYEIYVFESTGLSGEDIKETFESDPQFIVDFIRENGARVFGRESGQGQKQVIV